MTNFCAKVFGQDIRSLALMRCLVAIFLIEDIVDKLWFCEEFLSDAMLSRKLVFQRNPLIDYIGVFCHIFGEAMCSFNISWVPFI